MTSPRAYKSISTPCSLTIGSAEIPCKTSKTTSIEASGVTARMGYSCRTKYLSSMPVPIGGIGFDREPPKRSVHVPRGNAPLVEKIEVARLEYLKVSVQARQDLGKIGDVQQLRGAARVQQDAEPPAGHTPTHDVRHRVRHRAAAHRIPLVVPSRREREAWLERTRARRRAARRLGGKLCTRDATRCDATRVSE
eukprot:CAMPEP_0179632288 /NCGR_PEP_ID=MMETSP0932-20121108/6850_1 /TAXON_ID=548131 ORGANISM="Ostreococcus mediterraneus, Strain clade-D-RCC2596" /NCGR_SAMPLE_ID=MMETSP0932 /ASSEMBLY_ACC=CAM_ASM_000582 /LENGTH=193 /DNA_ID=CAMNT_0021501803 /DNA_START=283 /DNA_END=867 /DNA_ORIENTATION=-